MIRLMEKILHHLGPKGVNSGEKLTTKGHPEWCRIFSINSVTWVVPPPSNSHHQDYYIFSRESQPKPSFATVTGYILISLSTLVLRFRFQQALQKIGGCRLTFLEIPWDTHPEAKVITQTLGEQSIIWARFLKWSKQNGLKFWGHETLSPTNCLNHIGNSLRTPAVASRPILVTGEKPMIQLQKLFHTPTGKVRSLNIAYHGTSNVWITVT